MHEERGRRVDQDVGSTHMTIDISEEDRQMILLAIAQLAVRRPGWREAIRELAVKLAGEEMYEEFRRLGL